MRGGVARVCRMDLREGEAFRRVSSRRCVFQLRYMLVRYTWCYYRIVTGTVHRRDAAFPSCGACLSFVTLCVTLLLQFLLLLLLLLLLLWLLLLLLLLPLLLRLLSRLLLILQLQ